MPRTGYTNSPELRIQLDPQPFYRPGDSLGGLVIFQPSTLHPNAILEYSHLSFWARSKAKLIRSNGQTRSIYRGRAMLFSIQVQLDEIYDQTSADQTKGRTFRFNTIVPTHPSAHVTGDTWKPESWFLSNTNGNDTSSHPLPAEFYYAGTSGFSGTKKEAYVEYVLTLTAGVLKPPKKTPTTLTVTTPVVIRDRGPTQPISDFKPHLKSHLQVCKTLQLLPDKQDTSLTFRERMRSTFQPSKIPQYSFTVHVEYPTVIQLGNPRVPFKLRVEPREGEPLTTIPPSDYPSLELIGFELKLKCETRFRVQGSLGGTHNSDKSDEYTLYDSTCRARGAQEVSAVLDPRATQPFDLGAQLGLVVNRTCASLFSRSGSNTLAPEASMDNSYSAPEASMDGLSLHANPDPPSTWTNSYSNTLEPPLTSKPLPPPPAYAPPAPPLTSPPNPPPTYTSRTSPAFHRPLYPTFSTYNIAQTHSLTWRLKLHVLGTEDVRHLSWHAAVQVLPETDMGPGEFDGRGTGKNRDDLNAYGEAGLNLAGQIVQAISSFG